MYFFLFRSPPMLRNVNLKVLKRAHFVRWTEAKRLDGKIRLFNYDSLFDSDHAIRSGVVPGV